MNIIRSVKHATLMEDDTHFICVDSKNKNVDKMRKPTPEWQEFEYFEEDAKAMTDEQFVALIEEMSQDMGL